MNVFSEKVTIFATMNPVLDDGSIKVTPVHGLVSIIVNN